MAEENADLAEMEVELHRSLHRLVNMQKTMDRIPRDFGTGELLVGNEIHTIVAIGENPMMNITELAKKLGVTKAAASQAVGKLEKKNYVRKLRDMKNEREVLVVLSENGRLAHEGHKSVWKAVCSEFLSDLKAEQVAAFKTIAGKITASVETVINGQD